MFDACACGVGQQIGVGSSASFPHRLDQSIFAPVAFPVARILRTQNRDKDGSEHQSRVLYPLSAWGGPTTTEKEQKGGGGIQCSWPLGTAPFGRRINVQCEA